MTTLHWRGDAAAVAQITRVTPANVEAGDLFTLTVGNKSVSYTAAVASVADVTAGLATAWNAASAAELSEVTAADDTTHLTLTADVPGVPFSVSTSTSNGGAADTQTLTATTLVASAGPLHWDTPANWSTGALPVSGDIVHLERSDRSIRYGLEQAAVVLAELHIAASFTGEVGLPQINSSGATHYVEYRPQYLQIGSTEICLGRGSGEGSGRLQLNVGAHRTTCLIQRTGLPAEEHLPPVFLLGTHVNNALHVRGGQVGVAMHGGEVATFSTITQTGGRLELGSGTTLGTLSLTGSGQLFIRSSFSTLNQNGGEATALGTAGGVTINLSGGLLDWRSSGSITTLNITGDTALADFSHDARSRTISNCTLSRGEIYDPLRTVAYGAGIEPGGNVVAREAA